MALSILQEPGDLSFAGDPIIIQAVTTKTGVTFLRINITVEVTVSGGTSASHTEEYSYPVGSDGKATLNISKTIQSALDRYNEQTVSGTTLTQSLCKASFTVSCKEVWLEGVQEIEGATVNSETYTAIGGVLTEFERLKAPNYDTSALIGQLKALSRKPDGESVPIGQTVYVPIVNTVQQGTAYQIRNNGNWVSSGNFMSSGISIPRSYGVETNGMSEGTATFSFWQGDSGGLFTLNKRIVAPRPDMHRFIFLNGFGLAESITAVSREALSYEVSSEQFVVGREVSYRPNTEVRSYAQAPRGVLKMSSGFVSREWAEWWISEFITTRQAWMLVDDRYLPVAIIPEEENVVYDRTKPGLMSVNFSVQYAFTGGVLNSFV